MRDVVMMPAWFTPGVAALVLVGGCVLSPVALVVLVGVVA